MDIPTWNFALVKYIKEQISKIHKQSIPLPKQRFLTNWVTLAFFEIPAAASFYAIWSLCRILLGKPANTELQ